MRREHLETVLPPASLLDVVTAVQDCARSDREVVAIVSHLINSGRIVLRGNFAGQKIRLP